MPSAPFYFGPNNSNTSGSFSGGLAVEGSDSFLVFFAVFAWEGFDCSLFADPTTKLRGIGFSVWRSLLGIRILSPTVMRFGLSFGFALVRARQFSTSPVYHLAIIESDSPGYLTLW